MQKIQMELQELDAQEAGGLVEPRAWYQTMTPPAPEQLEQDSLARQKEWLQHQATPEQMEFFSEHGYLVVEDAIPPELLGRLQKEVDNVANQSRLQKGLAAHKDVSCLRGVMEGPAMLELLDLPKTFPILWDLMGWNIQLYISQLHVKPPEPSAYKRTDLAMGWHQDGGRPQVELAFDHARGTVPQYATPMLSTKIMFVLSDTTVPNCGAMRVVPGSHKTDAPPPGWVAGKQEPEGAIELAVKPGTAVFFERRTWHSPAHNYSDVTRKVLFFGFSFRWLRGLDYNTMPEEMLRFCDPIRRQLLGDSADIKGYWQPSKNDLPLRNWLKKNREGKSANSVDYGVFENAPEKATYRNWVGNDTASYKPIHAGASFQQAKL